MAPKKSATGIVSDKGYAGALQKLCEEEDVLIIPEFVVQLTNKQLESKKSIILEKQTTASANAIQNKEDVDVGETVPPPKVYIVYDHPEEKENPVAVICKGIYIEFTFIAAFGKSLESHPTITTLKIENCCASQELVEAVASLLTQEFGKRIVDLSLDGNENLSNVLPHLISYPTGIKYLSLQRCSLDDEGIKLLAEPLAYADDREQTLLVLNLSMNKIRNDGLQYLAQALRTNRKLTSLSLAGNQIEDDGVYYLSEVLARFKLTPDEVIEKRRRVFSKILQKKKLMEKYVEEKRHKEDSEVQAPANTNTKGKGGTIKKIRKSDGKYICLSSKDKRNRSNHGKLNSGEKFLKSETNLERVSATAILSPAEMAAIESRVDSEISPDKHPFVNECWMGEDGLWCNGCWSLASINLSYNYLTEKSVEEFSSLISSQGELFKHKQGLLRLRLLPGNSFEETSEELKNLQNAMLHSNAKKETNHATDSFPPGSAISARRLSSTTRRTRNR